MLKKISIILSILSISSLSFSLLNSEETPVIVISPGKTIQSLSTVGSTVEVIDGETINNSTEFTIAEIIDGASIGSNFFQMGGHGTNTAIQLRGLEKRYSTVYIDGIKMMDPSSADGSFYLENVMKNGIDRVEILKGNQSSLYGSNAIGGTINIFTKQGREGRNSNYQVETGSNNTQNFSYSMDGTEDKFNYFVGLNKFITDGVSAMNDNSEQDGYENQNIVGNLGYKINENFKIQNTFRYADTSAEYDEVAKAKNDMNSQTDNIEGSISLKLMHEKNQFKNQLAFNKLQIERYNQQLGAKQNYFGYRDAINYLGEYNLSLDEKIIYGVDAEFDASRYNRSTRATNVKHDEGIISQYFDYQFRPMEKLHATVGARRDDHTTVGAKESGRITAAYLLNGNSKIRSSIGSGIRFPALFDYAYGWSTAVTLGQSLEELQAERGNSFDIGYDTLLPSLDLGLNVTYFYTEQKNPLLSNAQTGWGVKNSSGTNYAKGVELGGKWKPDNYKFDLGFGYTFTDSYDANTCTYEQKASFVDNECRGAGSKLDTAKVRVPRHAVQTRVDYKFMPNFTTSLKGKYVGETRDYGADDDSWTDQILTDYFVFDLAGSYEVFTGYKLNMSINNLFNEQYQTAHQYTGMNRNLNIGLKKVY